MKEMIALISLMMKTKKLKKSPSEILMKKTNLLEKRLLHCLENWQEIRKRQQMYKRKQLLC